jgi:oligoribonuclease
MPALAAFLQDRVIDVTALKELARRWFPQHKPPHKKDTHRALEDILESIDELRFYKTKLFKKVQP